MEFVYSNIPNKMKGHDKIIIKSNYIIVIFFNATEVVFINYLLQNARDSKIYNNTYNIDHMKINSVIKAH